MSTIPEYNPYQQELSADQRQEQIIYPGRGRVVLASIVTAGLFAGGAYGLSKAYDASKDKAFKAATTQHMVDRFQSCSYEVYPNTKIGRLMLKLWVSPNYDQFDPTNTKYDTWFADRGVERDGTKPTSVRYTVPTQTPTELPLFASQRPGDNGYEQSGESYTLKLPNNKSPILDVEVMLPPVIVTNGSAQSTITPIVPCVS